MYFFNTVEPTIPVPLEHRVADPDLIGRVWIGHKTEISNFIGIEN
jgi:hypothetical protein